MGPSMTSENWVDVIHGGVGDKDENNNCDSVDGKDDDDTNDGVDSMDGDDTDHCVDGKDDENTYYGVDDNDDFTWFLRRESCRVRSDGL